MALFNLLTPGVYTNEIDLTERIRPASTNTCASVFWSLFGSLDKKLTTSPDAWLSSYGSPDPAISYATYSALYAHREVNQMWNLRVTNQARHSGISFLSDRERRLGALTLDAFDDGFVSPKEALHSNPDIWANGAYDVVSLVFSNELVAGESVKVGWAIVGTSPSGGPVDGEGSFTLPFNTSSDQTLLDIANRLKLDIDAVQSGSVVEVLTVAGPTSNDRIIRYTSPKFCRIGFAELSVMNGANPSTTYIATETPKLFDIYSENPGGWGNNLAVRWESTDQGQPQHVVMRFSRALVASNVFTTTVNGNAVSIAFFGSNDQTMANIAVALQQAMGPTSEANVVVIGGGSSNDREIVLKAPDAQADLAIVGAQVTGGVTQPSVIVTEKITRIPPDGSFVLGVYDLRVSVSTPVETHTVTLFDSLSADGFQTNIVEVINKSANKSRLIRVWQPEWSKLCDVTRYTPPPSAQNLLRRLTGGDDGFAPTAADFVRAWESFSNRDQQDIRILINGGYTVPSVQRAMVRIAEFRRDCIAVLDIPRDSQGAQAAVDFRRNELNINSSYGALYSPWCQVDDTVTGRKLSMPPSGFVAAVYARTDRLAYEWFAPAGLNRGDLSTYINGLDVIYERGETDYLFANQVNFILKKKGFPIWAAETLQYKKSALSNVSVRRLLITIEVSIADALDFNVFDPNDDETRFIITQKCEGLLSPIKKARGLYDYLIVCDERNNTAEDIDNQILNVDVYVKPVLPALYIKLNTIITRTGANFEESVATTLPQAA